MADSFVVADRPGRDPGLACHSPMRTATGYEVVDLLLRGKVHAVAVEIVVLHTDACPHVELARQRITEALATAGTEATVTSELVTTQEAAQRWGFAGSPTILMNGRDPFPTTGGAALACRLYTTEAGMQGAPTVAQLVEVLRW